jgi:hypothetical protein
LPCVSDRDARHAIFPRLNPRGANFGAGLARLLARLLERAFAEVCAGKLFGHDCGIAIHRVLVGLCSLLALSRMIVLPLRGTPPSAKPITQSHHTKPTVRPHGARHQASVRREQPHLCGDFPAVQALEVAPHPSPSGACHLWASELRGHRLRSTAFDADERTGYRLRDWNRSTGCRSIAFGRPRLAVVEVEERYARNRCSRADGCRPRDAGTATRSRQAH